MLAWLAATPHLASAHGVLALRPGLVDREKAIAAGDFNLDGKLDLVVANFEAGDVSLFQEGASGNYVERNPSPFLVLDGPSFIATGDINGDGRTDMVVVNQLGGAVSVRLSDPDLVFRATSNLLIGISPQAAVLADLNGNSKLDIAITSETNNLVFIFSGKGDGTFTFLRSVDVRDPGQVSASTDVDPYGIAAGDFNRDGKTDLAVTQRGASKLSILLGNGNGTFQTPVTYDTGNGTLPTLIRTARFNDDQAPGSADDFLDLAVLLEAKAPDVTGGAAIFLGNGDGTFSSAPSLASGTSDSPLGLAVGPIGLGAAGFDDLALVNFNSNTVSLYPSAGNGGFAPPVVLGGPGSTLRNPLGIVLLDRNGDGTVDRLVVSNYGGYSLSVFDGGGATPFTENPISPLTATRQPVDLDVGGLDRGFGDDLAVLSTGDPTVQTFSALGDGFFFKNRPTPLPEGSLPTAQVLSDLDRDSVPDLVVALQDLDGTAGPGTSPGLAIFKGNGNGTFGTPLGRCAGGSNDGQNCSSDAFCSPGGTCSFSPAYGTCAGGTNLSKPCTIDADCPSSTCTLPPPTLPLQDAATLLLSPALNPDDADLDGVPDSEDNCPARYNPLQENTRGFLCFGGSSPGTVCGSDADCPGGGTCTTHDQRGDACDSTTADPDADQIVDNLDNCPDVYNPDQSDADSNLVGDACDHSRDLVAVEGGSDQAEVFIGRQDTGFFAPFSLPMGPDPAGVVVGQVTAGDTHPDLAVSERGAGTLQIFAGDGSGGLSPGASVPVGGAPGSLEVLDANRNDLDLDGVSNSQDNCPTRYNPAQQDSDGDGLGDACSQLEDPDADLVPTYLEERADNCPDTYNPTQTDTDGDRIGDACDLHPTSASPGDDNDADGVPDATDNCPTRYNPDQRDSTGQGVGDVCDDPADTDGDGVVTALHLEDNCPDTYNPDQADIDFDDIGDACQSVSDLAVVDESANTVQVFIQFPPGTWVPFSPIPVGNQPKGLVAVDLNNDRYPDLVVSNYADSTVTILMGQGDGTFLMDPSFSTVALPAPVSLLRGGLFRQDPIQNLEEVAGLSQVLNNPVILLNTISERADVDGSDRVDGRDLAIWARGFGLTRDNPGYASLLGADVNLDGRIDGFDLVYISTEFGKTVPLP